MIKAKVKPEQRQFIHFPEYSFGSEPANIYISFVCLPTELGSHPPSSGLVVPQAIPWCTFDGWWL